MQAFSLQHFSYSNNLELLSLWIPSKGGLCFLETINGSNIMTLQFELRGKDGPITFSLDPVLMVDLIPATFYIELHFFG